LNLDDLSDKERIVVIVKDAKIKNSWIMMLSLIFLYFYLKISSNFLYLLKIKF